MGGPLLGVSPQDAAINPQAGWEAIQLAPPSLIHGMGYLFHNEPLGLFSLCLWRFVSLRRTRVVRSPYDGRDPKTWVLGPKDRISCQLYSQKKWFHLHVSLFACDIAFKHERNELN